jgi:hypothetical protein
MTIEFQTFNLDILNETIKSQPRSFKKINASLPRTVNEFKREKKVFLADLTNSTDLLLLL